MKIAIDIGGRQFAAQLNDSETAARVAAALPIDGRVSTWGEEIYFSIPVDAGEERAVETVDPGDIGYWPPGKAFCIFFGPTPMSSGGEIRPYSAVNLIGKLLADLEPLRGIQDGEKVLVRKAGDD